MNVRYIEIDSTYRNRTLWPKPGEFEIMISDSGNKQKQNALDPVCLSTPNKSWKSNTFSLNDVYGQTNPVLVATVLPFDANNMLGATNTSSIFIIYTPVGQLQQITNYYNNAVINKVSSDFIIDDSRRIAQYNYMGQTSLNDDIIIVQPNYPNIFTIILNGDVLIVNVVSGIYTISSLRSYLQTQLNSLVNPTYTFTVGIASENKYVFSISPLPTSLVFQTEIFASQIGFNINTTYFFTSGSLTSIKSVLSSTFDRGQFTVDSQFSNSFKNGDYVEIIDPTDFSDPNYPLIFIPNGSLGIDTYNQFLLYNENNNSYNKFTSYDEKTHIATFDTINPITNWRTDDYFCIRKEIPNFTSYFSNPSRIISSSSFYIDGYVGECRCDFIRLSYQLYNPHIPAMYSSISRIIEYDPITKLVTINPPFANVPTNYRYEILAFSYDNASPFVYTGSMISQQEEVCYEVKLLNLILPNTTLFSGQGSRIAFYPYVYTELTNLSCAGSGLMNTMYSNNPNSTKMLFKTPVTDVADPITTTFINLYGDDMPQTIKMKLNSSLKFSVRLQNGDVYETMTEEMTSPHAPNPENQITAMFAFKRI